MNVVMTKKIYSLLEAANTGAEVWAGNATPDVSVYSNGGLVNILPLPGSGMPFGYTRTVTPYQVSVRHADMYEAEVLKEKVISALAGIAEVDNGVPIQIALASDLGGVSEKEGEIWHYPVIFNVTWVRPA